MVRNLRVLAFVALLIVAISCSTDESVHCRFDADVTPHERDLFTQALTWNAVTMPDYVILIDPNGRERITFTTDIPSNGLQQDGRECTYEGKDCRVAHWIRIRRGMTDERTIDVSRHELGHALGMPHIPRDQLGTMHPFTTAHTITPADVADCQEVGACSVITTTTLPTDGGDGR